MVRCRLGEVWFLLLIGSGGWGLTGGGAETASGPEDLSHTKTALPNPSSGSLGTPEVVATQPVSGKEYAVSGWCHANLAGGQSPELTGRSINREPGGQL